jgi:hypothetical protein
MQRFIARACGVAFFGVAALTAIASANANYINTVLADAPTGYWRFDETARTTAANQVSGGAAGTYTGTYTLGAAGALTASGDNDTAYSATGATSSWDTWNPVGGCVSLGSSALQGINSSHDFSVEVWFNPSQTSLRGDVLNCKKGTWPNADYNDFGLITEGGTVSVFHQVGNDGGNSQSASINSNTWYDAVITRASGNVTFYVNGQVIDNFADSCSLTGTSVLVGANNSTNYSSYAAAFSGSIDDFAIYDHALTASQVAAHYSAATTVPEPSTVILFGSGVIGLLAYAWRKRK